MNVPDAVREWCRAQGLGEITGLQPVSGGCINNGARLTTSSGASLFLKQNANAPPDMFSCEAAGLQALADGAGPRVPEPHLHGASFLLTEDLQPAPQAPDYWSAFGVQLAELHQRQSQRFGFDHNNYLGSTPQPNEWTEDGHEFFREQRLDYQAELAERRGLLSPDDRRSVARLCERLPELVPAQPASLLHGDLWSGNAISDSAGAPAIIDPAAHYGWPEAELGMTRLFGGFPPEFYQSYETAAALEPGWRERLPVYNLYHLLNHLNLFGRSYLAQVQTILRRFA